jgi:cellulose synthase/poly-beta-1,6-N-acetylglucosamine synthase-like glycosyltransferase
MIDSLHNLNYPKKLYDIFVIADNCSDKTAELSREKGAIVYERFDAVRKGKGYALEWMFNKLFHMQKKYDAVAVFDADNLVSTQFLIEMNNKLCAGHKVIQGYIESKNPFDSWVTCSYSISFWSISRMFQIPRHNLNLSCNLWGTGFVIDMKVLKEIGWDATCLTEDLEFTMKLVLNNYKVVWAHHAVVYDEKPLTLSQSWKQRKRWMQGHAEVNDKYLFKLLVKAFTEKDLTALHCAFYLLQSVRVTALITLCIIIWLQTAYPTGILGSIHIPYLFPDAYIWSYLLYIELLYTPLLVLIEQKFNWRVMLGFLTYPIFTLSYIPITILGAMDRHNKKWVHTQHTCEIGIDDLEKT